jgi:hypothetical protein
MLATLADRVLLHPLVAWLVTDLLSAINSILMRTERPGTLPVQARYLGLIGVPESASGSTARFQH